MTLKVPTGQLLRDIAFFEGVSDRMLTEIGLRCRWIGLEEGEALISAGECLDRVFFVLSGEMRFSFYTRLGKVVSLRGALQGSFIGEPAITEGVPVAYSIEAARPSTVAAMNARTFFEFAERDRNLVRAIIRTSFERQKLLAEQVIELSTLNVHDRIHMELLRLCRDSVSPDGSASISPIPTHADLARRIGTQREAVSRELSRLQQLGIVVRTDKALMIPAVSRLTELQFEFEE